MTNDPQYHRTDLGDDEEEDTHWEDTTTTAGCSDPLGDDDIEITISEEGAVSVGYRDHGVSTCQ